VDIAQQNLATSQLRVEQLQELVRVGKRPPADLYRQQAQAAADQSTLSDAQNRVQTDEIALLERLRLDPHESVHLVPPPSDTSLLGDRYANVDQLVREATDQRADLLAANARVTATREDIARARSGYLPRLDFGASVFGDGRFFDYANTAGVSFLTTPQTPLWDQPGRQTTAELQLGLSWALFDRFTTQLAVQQSRVAYDSARYAEEDLRLAVAGDVARAMGDYHTAVQQLDASRAGLEAAQQAFSLVGGRFEVGFASIVDVTTAQTSLVQAQAQRATAVLNLALRKRALGYAMGLNPAAPLP
jgi:outer membrane protein